MLRDDILPANLFAERWAHIFRMMTDQNIWLNVSVSVSFFKTGKFQHVAVKSRAEDRFCLLSFCPD